MFLLKKSKTLTFHGMKGEKLPIQSFLDAL